MGAENEETETEERMVYPPGAVTRPKRKSFLCTLGVHKFCDDGDCVRLGCDHNWLTALHEDTYLPPSPAELPIFETMFGGGTSGEGEARVELLKALGPGWNVTFECGREGDVFRIEKAGVGAFTIKAAEQLQLRHSWQRDPS